MVVYTLATWDVKAGEEDRFISAWNAMGAAFQASADVPVHGTLLRRQGDPLRFVSFGAWPDKEAVAKMRADPAAQAALRATLALCSAADPAGYDVVVP